MKKTHYYILLGFVVLASGTVAILLLPHGELLQTLASIPLLASLTAVAVEILRDQAKRQHESDLANTQQRFALAAGSHMASTAFDKHVAFCEEYVGEVHAALRTLFREGPCQEALAHSNQLHVIKQKYVVWVTRDLEALLEPFETALRRIGAVNFVEAQFPGNELHQRRTQEMFRLFAEVLGTEHMGSSEWEGEAITDSAAVSRVISHLRDALGVEELTLLRNRIVQQALVTGHPPTITRLR